MEGREEQGYEGRGAGVSFLNYSAQLGRGITQSLTSCHSPRTVYKWGKQKQKESLPPVSKEPASQLSIHKTKPMSNETFPSLCSERWPLRFYTKRWYESVLAGSAFT